MCRPFFFSSLRGALSLPVFGEGRVGFFLAAARADPTRPRYRSATLPEAGEDHSFSFFLRCPSVRRRSALRRMKPAASRWS